METQVEHLKALMLKNWNQTHWVYETQSDSELSELIKETGSVEKAYESALETSKTLDEIRRGCF